MDITSPTKRPAWRPSEYREEYCQTVIEQGKLGKSKIQMAVACNVSKTQTLDDWAERHEEFSSALEMALLLSQDHWENIGQKMIIDREGERLNASYTKQMAARYPKTWRENTGIELSGGIKTIAEAAFASRPDGD